MTAKKEASLKEIVDQRSYFKEVGIKASDVFYTNQDRYQAKAKELKGTGKNEASALKSAYELAQEQKYKDMREQAAKR